jgi:hypothetical protein
MIHSAVHTIIEHLNAFALKKTGNTKVAVVHSLESATTLSNDNKILVTLVGVEEDRISANRDYYNPEEQKYFAPEVKINLILLFSTFAQSDYMEKLKSLSIILGFFQTTLFLENKALGIKRLTFELQTLSFEQQSYIWGLVSMKYSPCVVYRVRVVAIKEREVLGEGAPITQIEIASHGLSK